MHINRPLLSSSATAGCFSRQQPDLQNMAPFIEKESKILLFPLTSRLTEKHIKYKRYIST